MGPLKDVSEGKYQIELNVVGDGRVFINYWDSICGEDIICEVFPSGALFIHPPPISGDEALIGVTLMKLLHYIGKVINIANGTK